MLTNFCNQDVDNSKNNIPETFNVYFAVRYNCEENALANLTKFFQMQIKVV